MLACGKNYQSTVKMHKNEICTTKNTRRRPTDYIGKTLAIAN